MPSTSVKTLMNAFAEEYHQGVVVEVDAGSSTTSFTVNELIRATAGNEFGRNVPILFTDTGGAVEPGEESYLSDYNPNTGVITLTTALSDTPANGDEIIIMYPGGADSFQRWLEALNRFLTRVAKRRDKVALTCAGRAASLEGASSLWTLSNATVTYVLGDPLEPQLRRYLQVTATSDNGYATPGSFSVAEGETYEFLVPVVWPSATSVGKVIIWDDTNDLAITPTYDAGAASFSGATRQSLRGSFVVPSGCDQVQIRYAVTVSGQVVLFGPALVARDDATELPVPVEIETVQELGSLYEPRHLPGLDAQVAGSGDGWLRRDDVGWEPVMRGFGTVVSSMERLPFPCYVEAAIGYDELGFTETDSSNSLSETTACPQALALAGMAVEFFKQMHHKERLARGPDSAQTRWGGLLERAEADLHNVERRFDAPKKITVRRYFSGRARA